MKASHVATLQETAKITRSLYCNKIVEQIFFYEKYKLVQPYFGILSALFVDLQQTNRIGFSLTQSRSIGTSDVWISHISLDPIRRYQIKKSGPWPRPALIGDAQRLLGTGRPRALKMPGELLSWELCREPGGPGWVVKRPLRTEISSHMFGL